MKFGDYLAVALPTASIALALLLGVVSVAVQPAADIPVTPLRQSLSVAVVEALHARIAIDRTCLLPAGLVVIAMFAAWTVFPAAVLDPALVAWLGAAVLVLALGAGGRDVLLKGVDIEATLFLFGLLVLVGSVRESGFFVQLSSLLATNALSPTLALIGFVALAGLSTGLFSAGPSMAAMLELAPTLAARTSPTAVYLGLAFGVCAGSSLLLTAATSGPLAQSMVERAGLRDAEGRLLTFGFKEFGPVGVMSFVLILTVDVAAILILTRSP
jgi:Na+/H+ antiporter NhaD/arsenite permease-like protein